MSNQVKTLQEKIKVLEKEKVENQKFLLSLIIQEKEAVNKIRMFQYLVEHLNYSPSEEEVIQIITLSLKKEEQATFFTYVKKKFPNYEESVYFAWVAYGKNKEAEDEKERVKAQEKSKQKTVSEEY